MPVLILIALAALAFLMNPGVVTGYVNGKPVQITTASIGGGFVMRSDAAAAFNRMKAAAELAGVILQVDSAFRTWGQQARLYAMYLAGTGNLAAEPGHSNHQSGVAVDINTKGPDGQAAYAWLVVNAQNYGFRRTVASEPWHWEYSV